MRIVTLLFAFGSQVWPGLVMAGPRCDHIAELSRLTSGGVSPTTTRGIPSPGVTTTGNVGAAGMAAAKPGEASETGTRKQTADQAASRLSMAKATLDQASLLDEQSKRRLHGNR